MKADELLKLGIPKRVLSTAFETLAKASKADMEKERIREELTRLVSAPDTFRENGIFKELAAAIQDEQRHPSGFIPREEPALYRSWGENLEPESIRQMEAACELPIAVRGALMPDAHLGYGLPIGGVLAADNAVIPYAVGMDIACRMRISVLDIPVSALEDINERNRLKSSLSRETAFGKGAGFKNRRRHEVMDEDWDITPVTRQRKDLAWKQLGSSGSGNHFVEYGELTVDKNTFGADPGTYVALLSHSGSRGTGAQMATYYSKLAQEIHSDLPKHLIHLAWLDMDSAEGQEYWAGMELMGRYAAANHYLIHRHITESLGCEVLADIENHHNFAWKEIHDGKEVIVHRKGATPAGKDVFGVIPGSMGTAAYVIQGKGNSESLMSASHGAGRLMSRAQAFQTFTWEQTKEFLKKHNVELMAAGLDESPMAYKDIEEVMKAQEDLVTPVARFLPRIVLMAKSENRRKRKGGKKK